MLVASIFETRTRWRPASLEQAKQSKNCAVIKSYAFVLARTVGSEGRAKYGECGARRNAKEIKQPP